MTRSRLSLSRIFAAPAAIAALTLIGLTAALLGHGLYDALAWITLGGPLVAVAWLAWRRGG